MWSSYSVYRIALGVRGLDSFAASCRYVGKRLIPGEPATGALIPSQAAACGARSLAPRRPRHIARREIMLKIATAALLCSAGLVVWSNTADARCGCRKNCCGSQSACCTPAPTCAAPAPSCCAPAAPSGGAPAAPPAPTEVAPPAPTAGVGTDPSVAMDGRQTYRSYSYNPTPAPAMAAPATPKRSRAPWDNIGKADRKILGYY
jgi:hypothetical protein